MNTSEDELDSEYSIIVNDTEDNENLYDYLYFDHIPCFAHTLQLVIKDAFKEAHGIRKVLSKASSIVSHVRTSIHSSEFLETEKRLQAANTTRWNSQLTMIRSLMNIPLEKLSYLKTKQYLTTYDRKILQDLIEILTPFEKATLLIQGEKNVTGSLVIPCIRVLKATLDELSKQYNSTFFPDIRSSTSKILTPYENCEVYLTATMLDPRFKLYWCKTRNEYTVEIGLFCPNLCMDDSTK